MPQAIIFDLDNTLIHRDRALAVFLRETLGEVDLSEILERDAGGRGDRRVFCHWLHTQHPQLDDSSEALWQSFSTRIAEYIETDTAVCDLVERVGRTYRLALVTNGGRGQRIKIKRAGLAGYFKHVLVSSEVGIEKPSPVIFAMALEALGTSATNTFYVGDDPKNDVRGPHALGMKTCWLSLGRDYPSGEPVPTHTIGTLSQLEMVIAC